MEGVWLLACSSSIFCGHERDRLVIHICYWCTRVDFFFTYSKEIDWWYKFVIQGVAAKLGTHSLFANEFAARLSFEHFEFITKFVSFYIFRYSFFSNGDWVHIVKMVPSEGNSDWLVLVLRATTDITSSFFNTNPSILNSYLAFATQVKQKLEPYNVSF